MYVISIVQNAHLHIAVNYDFFNSGLDFGINLNKLLLNVLECNFLLIHYRFWRNVMIYVFNFALLRFIFFALFTPRLKTAYVYSIRFSC